MRNESDKDAKIDELIAKAEKLVADLGVTVVNMKLILTTASADIQEAKNEQRQ